MNEKYKWHMDSYAGFTTPEYEKILDKFNCYLGVNIHRGSGTKIPTKVERPKQKYNPLLLLVA